MRLLPLQTAVALCVASAIPVLAQSSPFYMNGYASADYGHSAGVSVRAGVADLSFGIAPQAGGSFGGIGFEVGVYGTTLSAGGVTVSDAIGYGAITFALGGGRLQVGAPRSGAWGYSDVRVPGGAATLLSPFFHAFGITQFSTTVAMGLNRPFLGLRYDRESGALRYSASLARLSVIGNHVDAFGLGVEHSTDRSRAYGTLEVVSTIGTTAIQMVLGGSTHFASGLGDIEVGGALTRLDTGVGAALHSVNVFATAPINDRLSITGSVLHRDFGGGQTLYGLNAQYDIWNDVLLNVGVAGASPGSEIVTVGLSRHF